MTNQKKEGRVPVQRHLFEEACASLTEAVNERDALRAEVNRLHEQLSRSATVCPKDGCMLWKGHEENHATAEQVSEALAANSHGRRL